MGTCFPFFASANLLRNNFQKNFWIFVKYANFFGLKWDIGECERATKISLDNIKSHGRVWNSNFMLAHKLMLCSRLLIPKTGTATIRDFYLHTSKLLKRRLVNWALWGYSAMVSEYHNSWVRSFLFWFSLRTMIAPL